MNRAFYRVVWLARLFFQSPVETLAFLSRLPSSKAAAAAGPVLSLVVSVR